MEKQFLKNLLDKFQAGTISEREKEQLDLWYQSFEEDESHTQTLSEGEKAAMEASLLRKINAKIDVFQPTKRAWLSLPKFDIESSYIPNLRTAVVFSLVIAVAAFTFIFFNPPTVVHATEYGQTSHITLPDQSIVILNGNTRLSYKKRWSSNGIREVVLEGEAFFNVIHTQNHQRFLVHTPDDVFVDVLGTEFTLSNRRDKTRIVLNSGKIELNIKGQRRKEKVIMNPGELVELGADPLRYTKKNVDPEVYSSWKDKNLILDHTSLGALLIMIEETYGLELRVARKDLLGQKISGKLPLEHIDTLIKDISAIYKVEFENYQ